MRDWCANRKPSAQKCDTKGKHRVHYAAADAAEGLGQEAAEPTARGGAKGADKQAEGEPAASEHGQGRGQLQSARAQEHDTAQHGAACGDSKGGNVPESEDQGANGSGGEVAGVA